MECEEKRQQTSFGNWKSRLTAKNKETLTPVHVTKFAKKKSTKKNRTKKMFHSRRALSPIFSTLILAAIVIIFGAVAYNYANNETTNATNNYIAAASNDQNALSERIGFENVVYTSNTLTVSLINCGKISLQIKYLLIYDGQNRLVGTPISVPTLAPLPSSQIAPDHSLNVGKEGIFTVTLPPELTLNGDTAYTVKLITSRGSSFDYTFAT